MRLLALGLVLAGCNSGLAPPLLEDDASVYDDAGGGDGGSLVTDGGRDAALDLLAGDMVGVGALCSTPCDCTQGLGCVSGHCGGGALASYCCTHTPCPTAAACQYPSQAYSQCGATTDGGVMPPTDGGMITLCTAIACTAPGDAFCQLACLSNTAMCTAGHCVPN